jgi:hypothetical protein
VKATSFTVVTPTLIQAIVPVGAKTGKVKVITPNGTAASKTKFTINWDKATHLHLAAATAAASPIHPAEHMKSKHTTWLLASIMLSLSCGDASTQVRSLTAQGLRSRSSLRLPKRFTNAGRDNEHDSIGE